MTQEYIKNLRHLGILLAAVSRNDPEVKKIFSENKELALNLLTHIANRLFQLVNGNNVIRNLQAKLYSFHRFLSCGLAGELVER